MLTVQKDTPNQFGGKPYLGFEHVTLVPMQQRMIDTSLLTPTEITWLNEYHQECLTKISPLLPSDSRALAWLKRETVPLKL